jgi:hypothetical protein
MNDDLKQRDADESLRDPHRQAVLKLRLEDDPVDEEVPLFERRRPVLRLW